VVHIVSQYSEFISVWFKARRVVVHFCATSQTHLHYRSLRYGLFQDAVKVIAVNRDEYESVVLCCVDNSNSVVTVASS
jgi:hypothetical protein